MQRVVEAAASSEFKICTFYRNGDPYFVGKSMRVSERKYRSWEIFLADLAQHLNYFQVTRLIDMDTQQSVFEIKELRDGGGYACCAAPTERFKPVRYLKKELPSRAALEVRQERPQEKPGERQLPAQPAVSLPVLQPRGSIDSRAFRLEEVAKIIQIFRNGDSRIDKPVTVVVNKRMLSIEQLQDVIGQMVPCPGGPRALFSLAGVRITDLSQLVKGASYVIVGREKFMGLREPVSLMPRPTVKPRSDAPLANDPKLPPIDENRSEDAPVPEIDPLKSDSQISVVVRGGPYHRLSQANLTYSRLLPKSRLSKQLQREPSPPRTGSQSVVKISIQEDHLQEAERIVAESMAYEAIANSERVRQLSIVDKRLQQRGGLQQQAARIAEENDALSMHIDLEKARQADAFKRKRAEREAVRQNSTLNAVPVHHNAELRRTTSLAEATSDTERIQAVQRPASAHASSSGSRRTSGHSILIDEPTMTSPQPSPQPSPKPSPKPSPRPSPKALDRKPKPAPVPALRPSKFRNSEPPPRATGYRQRNRYSADLPPSQPAITAPSTRLSVPAVESSEPPAGESRTIAQPSTISHLDPDLVSAEDSDDTPSNSPKHVPRKPATPFKVLFDRSKRAIGRGAANQRLREAAATKIQAGYRGYLVRRDLGLPELTPRPAASTSTFPAVGHSKERLPTPAPGHDLRQSKRVWTTETELQSSPASPQVNSPARVSLTSKASTTTIHSNPQANVTASLPRHSESLNQPPMSAESTILVETAERPDVVLKEDTLTDNGQRIASSAASRQDQDPTDENSADDIVTLSAASTQRERELMETVASASPSESEASVASSLGTTLLSPAGLQRSDTEVRSEFDEKYNLEQLLGDGNFAVVHVGRHRKSNKKCAVKIIDKSKTINAKETTLIQNEVTIMRRLNHPNCIKLFDVYETSAHVFMVMELVTGGDLFDNIINKGKYTEADASSLMWCMASAISYMHGLRIVHRDLKPENLLVAQDGAGRDFLKLGDFGLSVEVKEPLDTVCGTPTYVAPEIIDENVPGYGLEVDLWAMGVIIYIVLCGFPPFSIPNKDQQALFAKICRGEYTFPFPYWKGMAFSRTKAGFFFLSACLFAYRLGVSFQAKDLITKLLLVNPARRLSAAQVLEHPWVSERATIPDASFNRQPSIIAELYKSFPDRDPASRPQSRSMGIGVM
eukprot:m.795438 g.795438  ORF g.795438 m.795438 type:complete len:1191 (+) comp59243_c0_seq1:155-3727(+)